MQLAAIVLLAGLGLVSGDGFCTYPSTCSVFVGYHYDTFCYYWGWWCIAIYEDYPCDAEAPCTTTWDEWSLWSKECGKATRKRTGTCTSEFCQTTTNQEDTRDKPCPKDGGWSDWTTTTGACSVSCGQGFQAITKERTCTNPAPSFDGNQCVGAAIDISSVPCTKPPCAVHGGWTEWDDWQAGECENKNCTKTRSCTNPPAQYGGRECEGPRIIQEYQLCDQEPCKGEHWSEYSAWTCSESSATCGKARQTCTMTRHCLQDTCEGSTSFSKVFDVYMGPCPVHGGLSAPMENKCSECSATCGEGTRTCTRRRLCIDPVPMDGGRECMQPRAVDSYVEQCYSQPCPVDGEWTTWYNGECGECSATCGEGQMTCNRIRICRAPKFGGKPCEGPETAPETKPCQKKPCPIDGGWSSFGMELCGDCSATCGAGTKVCHDFRQCNSPAPQHQGKSCEGHATRSRVEDCTMGECPPPPEDCSVDCSGANPDVDEYYPHPLSLDQFYVCRNGIRYEQSCVGGTYWSDVQKRCEHPEMLNLNSCHGGNTHTCQKDAADEGVTCAWADVGCPEDQIFVDFEEQVAGEMTGFSKCENGLVALDDGTNCSTSYFQCYQGLWGRRQCAPGTYFNLDTESCGYTCSGDQGPVVKCVHGSRQWDETSLTCNGYIVCDNGYLHSMTCAKGLRFDRDSLDCVWYEEVSCPTDTFLIDPVCTPGGAGTKFRHPDCNMYYECDTDGTLLERPCGPGIEPYFNPALNVCDWPENVPECFHMD